MKPTPKAERRNTGPSSRGARRAYHPIVSNAFAAFKSLARKSAGRRICASAPCRLFDSKPALAAYKLVVRAIINPEKAVDARSKNFLTEAEIGNFLKAARKGRHSIRNFAMLLTTLRHGLRVSELINMRSLADGRPILGQLPCAPGRNRGPMAETRLNAGQWFELA